MSNTTMLTLLRPEAPLSMREEIRNLCRLLEEETIGEIENPEVNIKCIEQLIIRIGREADDVEEAHVIKDYSKTQREHLDLIVKLLAWYYQCSKKGLYAQVS